MTNPLHPSNMSAARAAGRSRLHPGRSAWCVFGRDSQADYLASRENSCVDFTANQSGGAVETLATENA